MIYEIEFKPAALHELSRLCESLEQERTVWRGFRVSGFSLNVVSERRRVYACRG